MRACGICGCMKRLSTLKLNIVSYGLLGAPRLLPTLLGSDLEPRAQLLRYGPGSKGALMLDNAMKMEIAASQKANLMGFRN